MDIKQAQYTGSFASLKDLPVHNLPEYAFVGRSNVGKSSWINCLCQRSNLAHTSSTPGKTQTINHYLIDDSWYLVDLPGYGYARTSRKLRAGFAQLITDYVLDRDKLVNLYVLVDSRIPPQQIDLEFMIMLGEHGIPFTILLTKIDKPNQKESSQNLKALKTKLGETWEPLPPMMLTSAVSGRGRQEVLDQIGTLNDLWRQAHP
ncbi:MAG: ribosome biogenesis GTP-binding protein YihA/YsxC [Bacteroidia bacterium]